jgi:transposase
VPNREVNKVILMFLNHAKKLVNALIGKVNNAIAKSLNGKTQEVKLVPRRFRTFGNFRNAILFFHGRLDLNPLIPYVQE